MSFLDHLGNVVKRILHIGDEAAILAEPFVVAAFPEVAPLYNSALGLAATVQAAAVTASGTGPQKLSQLVTALLPIARKFANDNNLNWPDAEIQKWASAVVDTMDLIPAPTPKA